MTVKNTVNNYSINRKKCFSLLLLLSLSLVGCGQNHYPPVEVLSSAFGIVERTEKDRPRLVDTKVVPLNAGQGYGWIIDIRTNLEKVQYTEQVTLSGPTSWGVRGDIQYEISTDKNSITVKRETAPTNGRIVSVWRVSADDPPGKATITIKIENEVEQTFDFELKKP